jgi:hypothetical protein
VRDGRSSGSAFNVSALKHAFDTVYYPSLDHVAGRPYGLWVHGNNDTVGAATAVEKVATGLSLASRRRLGGHRRHRRRSPTACL